jgi:hypothetical protein
MSYTIVSGPAEPIIPLDMLHLQLKLGLEPGEAHPEDALILQYLAAAREYAQHQANRLIGPHVVEVSLDAFAPALLPVLPFVSVTSVKYMDADLAEQTMDAADYAVTGTSFGLVGAAPEGATSVKITYVAGDLPAAVIDGLLLLVGYRFRVRQEASEREMQRIWLGAQAMFDTVKVWHI